MAVVLVKETGTGSATSNSYASAADGDTYHDKHYYASVWTAATTPNKEKALMMATRLIDESYQFNGTKKVYTSALQWPREAAVDPDRRDAIYSALDNVLGPYFDSGTIPQVLQDATIEFARMLLTADRTTDPLGQGMDVLNVSGININFSKPDEKRPIIPELVQTMLTKLGTLINLKGGTARLVRV
jgi:hypothetical protein